MNPSDVFWIQLFTFLGLIANLVYQAWVAKRSKETIDQNKAEIMNKVQENTNLTQAAKTEAAKATTVAKQFETQLRNISDKFHSTLASREEQDGEQRR